MSVGSGGLDRLRLPRALAVMAAMGLWGGGLVLASGVAGAQTYSPYAVTNSINVGGNPDGVVFDQSTRKVLVANSASNTVSVINANTGKVTDTIPVGLNPGLVALDSSTHILYVANGASEVTPDGADTVSVIDESGDTQNNQVTATIPVALEPQAMAVDPSNHDVYLIDQTGRFSVIDESGDAHHGQVTSTFNVGHLPSGMAVDPVNHNVYVTDFDSGTVLVVDESGDSHTNTVTATIAVGTFASAVAVDPSNGRVYVASYGLNRTGGRVSVIDASTSSLVPSLATDLDWSQPSVMTVDPSTHDLYLDDHGAGELTAVDESGDATNGQVLGSLVIGGYLQGMAVDPATHNLYIANGYADTVLVVAPSSAVSGVVTDSVSGIGIAGACVEVETASAGVRVELLQANKYGAYNGTVPPGSYKLIASDCVGGTHATTYYGGADNFDFLGPLAKPLTVTPGSVATNLDISLPLAGTISGTVTDSASGLGITGICAYAIDTTANQLRGYSTASGANGSYTIAALPPGTDRVAFQPCTTGPYPLTYSDPVTVLAGGVVTVNDTLIQS